MIEYLDLDRFTLEINRGPLYEWSHDPIVIRFKNGPEYLFNYLSKSWYGYALGYEPAKTAAEIDGAIHALRELLKYNNQPRNPI
jgi:hypothetical protein